VSRKKGAGANHCGDNGSARKDALERVPSNLPNPQDQPAPSGDMPDIPDFLRRNPDNSLIFPGASPPASLTLDDLAARIKAEHEQTIGAIRTSAEHAMRVGDLLIEAKKLVKHGEWLPWLAQHCDMSESLAQRYMRLARARTEIEANTDNCTDLSILGAMRLLAPPLTFEQAIDLVDPEEFETPDAQPPCPPIELDEDEPDELDARGEKEILEKAKEIRDRRFAERRAEWTARTVEISKHNSPLPSDRRYVVILVDAPWKFEVYDAESGLDSAADAHYPTMATDEIAALPVADLATRDAVLFLWSTAPHLPEALRVMQGWGFEYVTHLVWVKDRIGLGYWVRNQHELLLVGRRGDILTPAFEKRPSSVMHAARREHSRKPDEAYALIEQMYPELPKIELFARNAREGWAAWGNEAPGAAA
jgi:N6-adenosine-specific RNA methylase IME4